MVTLKGSTIIIKNEKDAIDLESKMAQIQMQYIAFVVSTLTTLLNQIIIDKIQQKMRDAKVSAKVIDRTYLATTAERNGQTITFSIMSDYISDSGFDVARMIEYGRRAYFVKPVRKKFLSWIKNGTRFFSKGHKIPQKAALHAIMDTIVSGQPKVQKELNKHTKAWLSEILKS